MVNKVEYILVSKYFFISQLLNAVGNKPKNTTQQIAKLQVNGIYCNPIALKMHKRLFHNLNLEMISSLS